MSRAVRPHAEAAGRCACALRAHTICAVSPARGSVESRRQRGVAAGSRARRRVGRGDRGRGSEVGSQGLTNHGEETEKQERRQVSRWLARPSGAGPRWLGRGFEAREEPRGGGGGSRALGRAARTCTPSSQPPPGRAGRAGRVPPAVLAPCCGAWTRRRPGAVEGSRGLPGEHLRARPPHLSALGALQERWATLGASPGPPFRPVLGSLLDSSTSSKHRGGGGEPFLCKHWKGAFWGVCVWGGGWGAVALLRVSVSS